jgi:hypothetical protein
MDFLNEQEILEAGVITRRMDKIYFLLEMNKSGKSRIVIKDKLRY